MVKVLACRQFEKCTVATPLPGIDAVCNTCPRRIAPGPIGADAEPHIDEPTKATEAVPVLKRHRVLGLEPDAFHLNNSAVRFDGNLWMAYRKGWDSAEVWLARLDPHTWNGEHNHRLDIHRSEFNAVANEDPQLFIHNGRLHCAFVGCQQDYRLLTHVMYCRLTPDLAGVEQTYLPRFEGRNAWEKNWSFFDAGGELFAVYRAAPHTLLFIDDDLAAVAYETDWTPPAELGLIRGGAPPVLHRGEFWHFFHGVQRWGGKRWYHIGVYTFEATPPFRPLRVLPEPLLVPRPVDCPADHVPHVVFPRGAYVDEATRQWVISFGYYDRFAELAAFDYAALDDAMVEVDRPSPNLATLPAESDRVEIISDALPRVWSITLDERPDRARHAAAALQAQNIPFESVRGFNGWNAGIRTAFDFETYGYKLNPGNLGLNVSWFAVLTAILADLEHELHVVLEDDAQLVPNFADALRKIIAEAPRDCELVYLGHCCTDDKPREQITPHLARINHPLCTHALLISKAAAAKLLRASALLLCQIDIQFERLVLPALNYLCAVPPLATQNKALQPIAGKGPARLHWHDIPGWFDFRNLYDELVAWLEQLQGQENRVFRVVEIGAWLGRSTAYLAGRLPPRVEFYTVDTWQGSPNEPDQLAAVEKFGGTAFFEFNRNLTECGCRERVVPICNDSVAAARRFDAGSVDFVFIDGAHTLEAVTRDINAWRPAIRDGGILAGHDYDQSDVANAVDSIIGRQNIEKRPPRSWLCQL